VKRRTHPESLRDKIPAKSSTGTIAKEKADDNDQIISPRATTYNEHIHEVLSQEFHNRSASFLPFPSQYYGNTTRDLTSSMMDPPDLFF
jgi:hypothetical protein